MARSAAAVACALSCMWACAACADNPYVIGRAARDAGARDAASADAASDAAADAGADECSGSHAQALLCSGFESPDLLADWDDRASMLDAEIERTSVRAHSGTGALRATSMATMSAATVRKRFGPVSAGELYIRLHAYVPAGLPTRTMNFMFVGDVFDYDSFVGLDFNLLDGALQVFSPQGDPQRQTGSGAVPRDRWFCLRARIAIADAGEGSVQLFVDDALALDASGLDTLPPDGLGALRLGIDWSSEQDDFFEIYLDDVVLDLAPVSCR